MLTHPALVLTREVLADVVIKFILGDVSGGLASLGRVDEDVAVELGFGHLAARSGHGAPVRGEFEGLDVLEDVKDPGEAVVGRFELGELLRGRRGDGTRKSM